MIEEELRLVVDDIPGVIEYANLPPTIGAVISSAGGKAMATLGECQTIYSVEDVYLMLEVIAVDVHNRRMADDAAHRKERR